MTLPALSLKLVDTLEEQGQVFTQKELREIRNLKRRSSNRAMAKSSHRSGDTYQDSFDGKHKIEDRYENDVYHIEEQPRDDIPVYTRRKEE